MRYKWTSLLLVLVLALGCNKKQQASYDDEDEDGKKTKKTEVKKVASTGTATLKGKAVYEGTPPQNDLKSEMKGKADESHCTIDSADNNTMDPTWAVGPNNAAGNVVVWVAPPDGFYFDVPAELRKKEGRVEVDQPFCMFQPYVSAFYPSYYDGKKQTPTGQMLIAKNSAPITHNTKWQGSEFNNGQNLVLNPKQELEIKAQAASAKKVGKGEQITLSCDIHKFMKGYAWAFDHPYFAVVGKDGTFEIKNVPAGADLKIMYWHPSFTNPKELEKAKLEAGKEVTKDLKIPVK